MYSPSIAWSLFIFLIWTKHHSSNTNNNNNNCYFFNYRTKTVTWIIDNQTQYGKLLIYCPNKAINVIHIADLEDEKQPFPILQVAKKTFTARQICLMYTMTRTIHLFYWTRVTKCLYIRTTQQDTFLEMQPKQQSLGPLRRCLWKSHAIPFRQHCITQAPCCRRPLYFTDTATAWCRTLSLPVEHYLYQ